MSKKEKQGMTFYQKSVICFLTIILFICGTLLYSRYVATTGLNVKEYKIMDVNLPDSYHGLKIIHLSDVHYNTTIKKENLEDIVVKINQLKPDIVVLTGDLLDRETKYTEKDFTDIQTILSKIETKIGKYTISGNHDTKFTEWETVIKNSGFKNMNNTYETIYNNGYTPILISGVSSNIGDVKNISDKMKPTFDYIKQLKAGKEQTIDTPKYKILLMHEPDYLEDIDYEQFDLILAGHSHNGQVRIPGIGAFILPDGATKYYKEHYNINGTDLYVSSGLGTSTYPFRLFNKPSINFYRFMNK